MSEAKEPLCLYVSSVDGQEHAVEENILAALLLSGNLFVYKGNPFIEEEHPGPGIKISVNCNDLFYWGCADDEEVPFDELVPLYRAWKSGPYGIDKWVSMRRKMRPQKPVVERMKSAGYWDADMESLPERDQ